MSFVRLATVAGIIETSAVARRELRSSASRKRTARTSSRREAEENGEEDESDSALAHGQEKEDEDAGDEALRRQDGKRAIRIGQPVWDDATKDAARVIIQDVNGLGQMLRTRLR